MSDEEARAGLRARGEEALGELAQAMLENPVLSEALARAFGAGERAMQAQRSALGALNVATGSDLERYSQRLRSLSDRLEAVEDRVDEVAAQLASLRRGMAEPRGALPGRDESGEEGRAGASEGGPS